MSNTQIDDLTIQSSLRSSENAVDAQTRSRLSEIRHQALAEKSHWYAEYKHLFSTGIVTAALIAVFILPYDERLPGNDVIDSKYEDSVTLLMEDPEFFLWLNESGALVANR